MTAKFNIQDLKKGPNKNLLKNNSLSIGERRKVGRPKLKSEKLSKKITVNLTEQEFETLKRLSRDNFDVPLPKLIRGLLKEKGVI